MPLKEIFAKNLRALMEHHDYSQSKVADLTKGAVSQKTVSNVLNPVSEHSPGIDVIDDISKVFGLAAWQILVDDFDLDLVSSGRLSSLVHTFSSISTEEGRKHVETTAMREFEYSQSIRVDVPDRTDATRIS